MEENLIDARIGSSSLHHVRTLVVKKIFEILVVCDDIDWGQSSFEVMAPGFECFEDGQEVLVVHIVVYFLLESRY